MCRIYSSIRLGGTWFKYWCVSGMKCLAGLFVVLALQGAWARQGYGPGEQEWGHVTVREGAHLFYWLYYVQNEKLTPAQAPTIIWLEGGGVDSTGFGNFADIGPIFPDGTIRNHTWVKHANIIFVDSPVGVGYSYVEDLKYLTKTREDAAKDLWTLLKQLLSQYPALKTSTFHIMGRVYGGTIGLELAKTADIAIKNKEVDMKLNSVTLYGSYLNPQYFIKSYADFLSYAGMVNEADEAEIRRLSETLLELIKASDWNKSLDALSDLLEYMRASTFGAEMLNTIYEIPFDIKYKDNPVAAGKLHHPLPNKEESEALCDSDAVRDALKINRSIPYNRDSYNAVLWWRPHLLLPNIEMIEYLLENTDYKISTVYGQFNAYFSAIGGRDSLTNTEWSKVKEWKAAPTKPFLADGTLHGYTREFGNFRYVVIDRAGHMLPSDNPAAATEFLLQVLGERTQK